IGFVGGSITKSPIHNNRYLRYGKAMLDAGFKIVNDFVYETQTTFEGGVKLAERLMNEHTGLTALVVDADIVALGIMKTYLDHGRRIPDDLSIVGFDDIQSASFVSPGLTTIRQYISKKGELAAKLVMQDILNNTQTKESKIVKSKLIIRGSTKPV